MPRQLNFREERQHLEKHLQKTSGPRHPLALILDRLENPRNIGAIFRLADAALIRHIYAYQMEDFARNRKFKKATRSAERHVPHSFLDTPGEVEGLKPAYQLVGLEITDTSIPYSQFKPLRPVALIIGNESRGISQELLDLTESCIHIPMYGLNTSLNVAMATGIAAYSILENLGAQKGKKGGK